MSLCWYILWISRRTKSVHCLHEQAQGQGLLFSVRPRQLLPQVCRHYSCRKRHLSSLQSWGWTCSWCLRLIRIHFLFQFFISVLGYIYCFNNHLLFILTIIWMLRIPNADKNLLFSGILHVFIRSGCKNDKNEQFLRFYNLQKL